jgi:plastocyanin
MRYAPRVRALADLLLAAAAFLAGCARPSDSGAAARDGPAPDRRTATTTAHDPEKAAPAEANQVVIDNFAFRPRTLTVAPGTRVVWVNRDDVPHTATSSVKPRAFDSKTLDTDDRFEHVFDAPGVYDYFCAVHPHMTGQVIVK